MPPLWRSATGTRLAATSIGLACQPVEEHHHKAVLLNSLCEETKTTRLNAVILLRQFYGVEFGALGDPYEDETYN